MSVINNVLKDLENKPSAFTPLDIAELSVTSKQKTNPSILWLVGVFLLMAVIYIGYSVYSNSYFIQPVQTPLSTPLVIESIVSDNSDFPLAIEEAPPRLSAEIKPPEVFINEITGLQIKETPEFMELEFQLSNNAQSYLKQRTANRYIFQIKDTVNSIDTPIIGQNPWLQKITISSVSNGVEIQFDTREGVLVETRDIKNEGHNYWLIRLKKSLSKSNDDVNKPLQPTKSASTKKVIVKQVLVSEKTEDEVGNQVQKKQVKLEIKPVIAELTDSERLTNTIQVYKAGKWLQAAQGFNQLIGSKVDKQARVHLLDLLQRQQKNTQREQLLSQSLNRYPDDMDFILLEANRLFLAKQYQALVQRFQYQKQNKNMLNLLANSYQRTGQHGKAIEHYSTVLKLDPQQPKFWIGMAISQQHEGQITGALHSYQMADRSGKLNNRLRKFVQQRIRQLSQ